MSTSRALTTTAGELHRLEGRIERGLIKLNQIRRAFVAVGTALRRIRGKRLYRQTHRSWEQYVRRRWHMCRNNADKLIAAAAVVGFLGPAAARLSAHAARKLIPFNARPDLQRKIVERARQSAARGEPTADAVARAAREVLEELGESPGRPPLPGPTAGEARTRRVEQILLLVEKLRLLITGLGPGAAAALEKLDQLGAAVHQVG
jgi:hypothetical protein